uniref:Uncharacterized protein n=1 Tax=Romanomermis culicivorax TaxID=13658 RepID=A0A915JYN9_ROMCU
MPATSHAFESVTFGNADNVDHFALEKRRKCSFFTRSALKRHTKEPHRHMIDDNSPEPARKLIFFEAFPVLPTMYI